MWKNKNARFISIHRNKVSPLISFPAPRSSYAVLMAQNYNNFQHESKKLRVEQAEKA